jgi:hypothetical protein
MKKSILFSVLTGVALLLSSCGTSYTLLNSNAYPGQNVTSYKTFSIAEYDETKLPRTITIYDVQNIQRAIANELSIRGYKEDKSGNGDLTVITTMYAKLDVSTKDAIPDWAPVRPMGAVGSMYYSYYDNAQIIDNISKDGVLAVDLVDTKTKKVVWDAAVSSVIEDNGQNIKNPAEINKACDKLFSKFPVPAPTTKK